MVKGPIRTRHNQTSLRHQQGDGTLGQKAFQNRAAICGTLDMGILDKGITPWPALMDRLFSEWI